jgi:allantoinase
MAQPELVIRGRRVVTENSDGPASLYINRGRIAAIASYDQLSNNCEIVEAGENSIVMAGLVDTHVHVNEPGRTDWEGFETATRAAAAGGVTTIVDMPLNSIPATTTLDSFNEKLEAARDKLYVDVGFWGGIVPGNTNEIAKLWNAGVVGFKCFLVPSGVEEFPNVSEAHLREAMPELARLGAMLIVHAELPGPIEAACCGQTLESIDSGRRYQTFLDSRPGEAEDEAVALMIQMSREIGCRIHIVHLSSAGALGIIRKAKADRVGITAETCPHYLHFAAEEIADGATEFKCCPPIRQKENREQLWAALREGTIDMVVSDHSPCPPAMKLGEQGDFMNAWGGISSLQLRLPVIWSDASARGFTINELANWLCAAPARQVALAAKKGSLRIGGDADVVIWNPDAEFRVEPKMIHHRHKLTAYAGKTLSGVVEKTFLRGQIVYDGGEFSSVPLGRVVFREGN